jgi:hypothetical protein
MLCYKRANELVNIKLYTSLELATSVLRECPDTHWVLEYSIQDGQAERPLFAYTIEYGLVLKQKV